MRTAGQRALRASAALCLALSATAAAAQGPASPLERVPFAGALKVELEPVERYYYPGQPIEIKASFRNPSGQFMTLARDLFDPVRFKIQDATGRTLAPAGSAPVEMRPADEPPAELYPRHAEERTYRLSERFPGLRSLGRYTVTWEHPDVPAATTLVRVIRAYDPDRQYIADVRTTMGRFTLEFFPSVAPKNVKNFIDLANSGFYDGMQFHMVIPGILIQTGDPKGDGMGYPGYRVPPEFGKVRHLKGTVSMWHHPSTVDAGSQFFIMLSDQPQFDGHYTVIGQVKSGLEVVEKIGEVPTTENNQRMPFRPLQSIRIEQIRIRAR